MREIALTVLAWIFALGTPVLMGLALWGLGRLAARYKWQAEGEKLKALGDLGARAFWATEAWALSFLREHSVKVPSSQKRDQAVKTALALSRLFGESEIIETIESQIGVTNKARLGMYRDLPPGTDIKAMEEEAKDGL